MTGSRQVKQILLAHGRKFLVWKENREWLEYLNFIVKAPGYTPPRTPSAMKNMPTASPFDALRLLRALSLSKGRKQREPNPESAPGSLRAVR